MGLFDNATRLHIKVRFTEELLGTATADRELYRNFIASKSPDATTIEEEVAAIGAEEVADNAMTVFPRNADGDPYTYDYQWRGFFKESASMLRRVKATRSAKLKAHKKVIDGNVFVQPRQIPLVLPDDGWVGECQRPLRAATAQGERVALACSETAPAGTVQEFDVVVMEESLVPTVLEWLEYGQMHGTGQWRNSGKGTFVFEAFDDDGKLVAGNA